MEKVKVRILEDGKISREVNPWGELKSPEQWEDKQLLGPTSCILRWRQMKLYSDYVINWQEAEQKLRTFEIEGAYFEENEKCKKYAPAGSIHTAQILETGKIRII